MTKFLKLKQFSCLIFVMILIGCGDIPVPEEVDPTANEKFFDVVYQAIETRENKNYSWTPVSGIMQMQIKLSTDTLGTFAVFYQNYKEPQFVYNTCSGGFKGNAQLVEEKDSTTDGTGPYNPLDPYPTSTTTVPTTTPTTTDPTTTVAEIRVFEFNWEINTRNLDPACRPESDRTVYIYRFQNGEILLTNEYREIRMKPVLTSGDIAD